MSSRKEAMREVVCTSSDRRGLSLIIAGQ